MKPQTTAEYEAAKQQLLAGRATATDEQLIESYVRERLDAKNVEFRLCGRDEVRFQSIKKQIMDTPKSVSDGDWAFAKNVVIQQKQAMRAKAWERYTANWTKAQHQEWLDIEIAMSHLIDNKHKGNWEVPVRWTDNMPAKTENSTSDTTRRYLRGRRVVVDQGPLGLRLRLTDTRRMEQPICALCGMVIKPTDCKVTFQGVAQHMRCWGIAAAPKRQDDRHGRADSTVRLTQASHPRVAHSP